MNALNEVNKVISMISNVSSRHASMDEDEWLTAEKMAVCRIKLFCFSFKRLFTFKCNFDVYTLVLLDRAYSDIQFTLHVITPKCYLSSILRRFFLLI